MLSAMQRREVLQTVTAIHANPLIGNTASAPGDHKKTLFFPHVGGKSAPAIISPELVEPFRFTRLPIFLPGFCAGGSGIPPFARLAPKGPQGPPTGQNPKKFQNGGPQPPKCQSVENPEELTKAKCFSASRWARGGRKSKRGRVGSS